MINGWYCRTMADGHNNPAVKSESSEEEDAMPVAGENENYIPGELTLVVAIS